MEHCYGVYHGTLEPFLLVGGCGPTQRSLRYFCDIRNPDCLVQGVKGSGDKISSILRSSNDANDAGMVDELARVTNLVSIAIEPIWYHCS